MQVQAFEGYWENEHFYPLGKPIRKTGRQKAILTFLSEPASKPMSAPEIKPDDEMYDGYLILADKVGPEEAKRRIAWLKRLHEAVELAQNEPPFELPPRAGRMRPPILFED